MQSDGGLRPLATADALLTPHRCYLPHSAVRDVVEELAPPAHRWEWPNFLRRIADGEPYYWYVRDHSSAQHDQATRELRSDGCPSRAVESKDGERKIERKPSVPRHYCSPLSSRHYHHSLLLAVLIPQAVLPLDVSRYLARHQLSRTTAVSVFCRGPRFARSEVIQGDADASTETSVYSKTNPHGCDMIVTSISTTPWVRAFDERCFLIHEAAVCSNLATARAILHFLPRTPFLRHVTIGMEDVVALLSKGVSLPSSDVLSSNGRVWRLEAARSLAASTAIANELNAVLSCPIPFTAVVSCRLPPSLDYSRRGVYESVIDCVSKCSDVTEFSFQDCIASGDANVDFGQLRHVERLVVALHPPDRSAVQERSTEMLASRFQKMTALRHLLVVTPFTNICPRTLRALLPGVETVDLSSRYWRN